MNYIPTGELDIMSKPIRNGESLLASPVRRAYRTGETVAGMSETLVMKIAVFA